MKRIRTTLAGLTYRRLRVCFARVDRSLVEEQLAVVGRDATRMVRCPVLLFVVVVSWMVPELGASRAVVTRDQIPHTAVAA